MQVTPAPIAHRRSFSAAGVLVHETNRPDGPPAATIRARLVRRGRVQPIPLHPGTPSGARAAVNAAAIFAVVLVAALCSLALGPMLLGYRPVVVGSGSMAPSLRLADVVVVKEPDAESVAVGSVIDVHTERGGLIHRVVEVMPDGFRTKGDANSSVDSAIVDPDAVRGIGVFLVPFVGLPRVWAEDGRLVHLAALAAAMVAAAYFARPAWLDRDQRAATVLHRHHRRASR